MNRVPTPQACVSLSIPGCMVAVSDIAPNYTGTLMGIINTVGQSVGFLTPLISTAILEGNVRGRQPTFISSAVCTIQVHAERFLHG